MQQFNVPPTPQTLQGIRNTPNERQTPGLSVDIQEAARAAERARLRQGIMHVRIRHFYCTLEEIFDPTLRGQCFVVGTGTGRPNRRVAYPGEGAGGWRGNPDGRVRSWAAREAVERVAWRGSGATKVENKVTIEPD